MSYKLIARNSEPAKLTRNCYIQSHWRYFFAAVNYCGEHFNANISNLV